MAPAKAFDFAAQLKVAFDLIIGQDAEAVDNRSRVSDFFYQPVRLDFEIGLVRDCHVKRVGIVKRFFNIGFDSAKL